MTLPTERNLTADRLAQYVKRNRCERFLRFSLFKSEADGFAHRYGVRFESLSPLLSESGQSYEREVVSELEARGATVRDLFNKPSGDFLDQLTAQTERKVFYYQAKLAGSIGLIECEGIADLILVEKLAADVFKVCVVDIKSSRRETTGYRLQVAFYARLLEEMFVRRNCRINELTGAIHLEGKTLSAEQIETFELGLYADEIERLVAAENSDVVRVVKAVFADTVYHLNHNCDGCRFNAACFVQAAETEDLSLIPQLTATEKIRAEKRGLRHARQSCRALRIRAERNDARRCNERKSRFSQQKLGTERKNADHRATRPRCASPF
jgi:CRISPR/Cas system-associated exonuclease Cas4 (RecB family)